MTETTLSCYRVSMKTITLTTEAYERLSAWKVSPKDSFSRVVQRVVPARGTLASVQAAAESLPILSGKEAQTLSDALIGLNSWAIQGDPWTT